MDWGFYVPLLSMGTLLAVCILALISKARVEARRRDPFAPKSSLAIDGPGPAPFQPETYPGAPVPGSRPEVAARLLP